MKYKVKHYHCDRCKKRTIVVEKESTVAMGWVFIVLGLCTSMFLVGIPLLIAGIVKISRGYRYKSTCTNCGFTHYSNRYVTEQMLREDGYLVKVGVEEKPAVKYRVKKNN